jgi:hypothetical protein
MGKKHQLNEQRGKAKAVQGLQKFGKRKGIENQEKKSKGGKDSGS